MKKLNLLSVMLIIVSVTLQSQSKLELNLSHLDYLYEEIVIDGKSMGIIHIYSEYPDYKYVDDDDEGTACVDDVARAAIVYLEHYKASGRKKSLDKLEKLVEFILYMQSDNGYFYNFIWPDHSINETFKTSVNEANWWSWRALWALTEAYNFYKNSDHHFAARILKSIKKIIASIKNDIPVEKSKINIAGFEIPDWLPRKHAADQAAVLLLGLVNYLNIKDDAVIKDYAKKIADGILLMQAGCKDKYPYGLFLSWENTWHAWGYNQSYSLLKAYGLFKEKQMLEQPLEELNYFYDFLIENNYYHGFEFNKHGDSISVVEQKKFPQIAYDFRPMILALLEAYKITSEVKYAEKAGKIAQWFLGNNLAGKVMYHDDTGRIYDGIINDSSVNKNSGAESTIEGLWALLKVKLNPVASKKLNSFMNE